MPQPARRRFRPARKWISLSVTPDARAFVARHAAPGEPVWQTIERLFSRLTDLPRGADPAQRRHQDINSAS